MSKKLEECKLQEPRSAYLYFTQSFTSQLRKSDPDLAVSEVMRRAQKEWDDLPSDQKDIY